MIDLRRTGSALTLYATHQPPPRLLWIAGLAIVLGALYLVQLQPGYATVPPIFVSFVVIVPVIVAAALYLRPQLRNVATSFDTATRRIQTIQKLDRGKDVTVEVGFDEVTALRVVEDNPERPRHDVLLLHLTDGRKIKLALKSRQYTEGDAGQDLRKVAAFIRSETGLPGD